jgi:hypothetical protein
MMNREIVIVLMLASAGCGTGGPSQRAYESCTSGSTALSHPRVDFEHWAKRFPIETFHKTSGIRRYDTTDPDNPLDLWKPCGVAITSPAHLCNVELVRKEYARTRDLGRSVPVDMFVWSVAPPEKPYLTKLGGVPHRESNRPWPQREGKPYTFVGQFCFADSRDIVSPQLPDDVMLIFFGNASSIYDRETVHIEWSALKLESPLTAEQCPAPSFTVPRLSGHIHRTSEYPDSWDVFCQEGHNQCYLFPTTQSTKIGRETFYVQNDPRGPDDELICALNSVDPLAWPPGAKWPFIGLETLPDGWDKRGEHFEWGHYRMMFADVGCMYFMIDKKGTVTWSWDSH